MSSASTTNGNAARSVRGFTLIEVLLATFIIAIGVLGLLALFAGAARQQQAATQSTVALFAAANAESGLIQNFGALTIPPGSSVNFVENVWYVLPMDPQHYYLTINPLGSTQGAYFLTSSSVALPRAVFVRPITVPDNDVGLPPELGFAPETDAPPSPYDIMTDFGQRRIDPSTLRIRVETSWVDSSSMPAVRVALPDLNFERTPGFDYQYDLNRGGSNSSRLIFPLNGDATQDPDEATPGPKNYIVVECELLPGGTQNARIVAIQIPNLLATGNFSSGRIERIEVTDFQWRNDQLSSLNDRLVFRADPTAPFGRRPYQAYSLLFRRTALGFQTAICLYELGATSSSARYVPPERVTDINGDRAPLRKADLFLRYDPETEEYYFRALDEQYNWAIAYGQILLVAGDPTAPNVPGSDTPVRITRQVRETDAQGGLLRGYIDRVPRFNNMSMLPIAIREAGRTFTVFAVSDSVRSLEDSSVWKLGPLDTRVIQVPLGN